MTYAEKIFRQICGQFVVSNGSDIVVGYIKVQTSELIDSSSAGSLLKPLPSHWTRAELPKLA